ncbi:major facilitator superfamily domain-containing protein 6 [Hydra vulgaris]|uniref:Major facilitator superfamily domain-containing protein 6 n=1 Tax=Hydra vulgaris TaxID=6087 RepID=A0ABM4CVR7_HYDVU
MASDPLKENEDLKENHETQPNTETITEEQEQKKTLFQSINRELIPPKLFYLFFFGANGTLIPYLVLFFKQLGLSPSQVGIVSGLKPFISFVCSPLWGYLADKSRRTKLIYIISLLAYIGGYLAYSFAPHSHVCKTKQNTTSHTSYNQHVHRRNFDTDTQTNFYSRDASANNLKHAHQKKDNITSVILRKNDHYDLYQSFYPVEAETSFFQIPPSLNFFNSLESSQEVESDDQFISTNLDKVPSVDKGKTHELLKDSWSVHLSKMPWTVCAAAKASSAEETNYQLNNVADFNLNGLFHYLLIVTIIATIFSCPLITIVDTATIRKLKKKNETHKYGKQRLWGSLGWGVSSFGVGSVIATISLCPGINNEVSYYPAFYTFTCLQLIALFIGLKLDFKTEEENNASPNSVSRTEKISQGLKLLKKPVYFFFIVTTFYVGVVMSIIKTFLFWHLKDIGGTQMLFSTISIVNCVAEVFVYFFSAKFIERVGHIRVLYIALVCYSLRLFYYGLLPNPWYVLAAEPLSGITTAAAWAAMTSYVGLNANNESVTTLQGILHGVHWGLGHGIGELIGGFMVSWVGAAMTFNIFGVLTILELLVFALINHLNSPKVENDSERTEVHYGVANSNDNEKGQ